VLGAFAVTWVAGAADAEWSGKTLLGRHRNQLIYPLTTDCVISDE
jgi:hypothetical protein